MTGKRRTAGVRGYCMYSIVLLTVVMLLRSLTECRRIDNGESTSIGMGTVGHQNLNVSHSSLRSKSAARLESWWHQDTLHHPVHKNEEREAGYVRSRPTLKKKEIVE
jgi:hypothetical protein